MTVNGVGKIGYEDMFLRFKRGEQDSLAVNGVGQQTPQAQAPAQPAQVPAQPAQKTEPVNVPVSQEVPAVFGSLLTPGVNPSVEVTSVQGVEGISKAPVIGRVQNEQGGENTLRGDGYGLQMHLPEKNGTYATNGLPYSKYKSSWVA